MSRRSASRRARRHGGGPGGAAETTCHGLSAPIVWHQTRRRLRQAYREEPRAEVRTRLHLLWLLREGWSLPRAAGAVGVTERSGRSWVRWYRQGGLEAVRAHHQGNPEGRRPYLRGAEAEALLQEVQAGRFGSVGQVRAWVQEHYGVRYSQGGMWRRLRQLGGRWNVPRALGQKTSPAGQEAWKKGG